MAYACSEPTPLTMRQHQVVDLDRQLGVDVVERLGHRRVLVRRGVQVQRAQTLGVGLLGHQRTTHVGVMRDGHARRGLVGHLGHVGALHAVLGVVQRVEVAGRQGRDGLGADHHAGLLDDVEHLRNALVHLADQPALGGHVVLAERQLTGGRNLQAHLVLDVGDVHAVALAELAGLEVEEELRHEEQRQTLGAGACALGAGQHQVEDVLEQVAGVTRGDEALHAVDVPGAVLLLDGLGAACADVRAGIGLGQHHGGAPAALGGEHGPLLLLLGAEVVEDVGEAGAAARTSTRRGWRRGCARAAPT